MTIQIITCLQTQVDTLSRWTNIATIIGAVVAVLALLYTAYQVRKSTNVSRGQFWLELEKMFAQHDEVHLKLRPSGEWVDGDGPIDAKDWAKVEDYMGLFEHCEIMLGKGLIDWDTFKALFSYRLTNIIANEVIVSAKLQSEEKYWKDFIKLLRRLDHDALPSSVRVIIKQ